MFVFLLLAPPKRKTISLRGAKHRFSHVRAEGNRGQYHSIPAYRKTACFRGGRGGFADHPMAAEYVIGCRFTFARVGVDNSAQPVRRACSQHCPPPFGARQTSSQSASGQASTAAPAPASALSRPIAIPSVNPLPRSKTVSPNIQTPPSGSRISFGSPA